MKQLSARSTAMAALLTAHLGNSFTDDKGNLIRLSALTSTGPALDINKLDQIAALPLGGQVKLNAWDDKVELRKLLRWQSSRHGTNAVRSHSIFPASRVTATEVPVNQTASAAAPADQAGTANHAPLNPGTR